MGSWPPRSLPCSKNGCAWALPIRGQIPPAAKTPDVDPAAARAHWAYQPLQQVAPPAVGDGQWPLGNVDRFVLAKLEASGLHPSPDADRYLWLRRVSLDLTGLPPTTA